VVNRVSSRPSRFGSKARGSRWHLSASSAVGALLASLAITVLASPAGAAVSWTVVPSPNLGTNNNFLNDIRCFSTTSCVAVGDYFDGITFQTLIESWNGIGWKLVPSPDIAGENNYLQGVSCRSTIRCKAVGYHIGSNGTIRTLIESWDGTGWSIVSSPNFGVNNNYNNLLLGISCPATYSCKAVGAYTNGAGVTSTLIESWNGVAWSAVSSPNNATKFNYLDGASCVSTTSCTAVGYYLTPGGVQQTLIESWDGSSWSIDSSPNAGTGNNVLRSVACTGTTCKAVGAAFTGATAATLVEAFNGSSWSTVTSPNQGTGTNNLNHIACASMSSCMAVGSYTTASNVIETLAESWNGTAWSILTTPNEGTGANTLNGVACNSATQCKAVGRYFSTGFVDRTLIETY